MEEKVLKILQGNNKKYEYLKIKLNLDDETLKDLLNDLINEGKIFSNDKDEYSYIKDEYIITKLYQYSNGIKYIISNDKKYNIDSDNLGTAQKNDIVVINNDKNNNKKVIGILKRANKKIICEIINVNGKKRVVPFFKSDLRFFCSTDILKNLVVGERISVELPNSVSTDNDIYFTSYESIGHKDDPGIDEKSIAMNEGFDIDFSSESMDELNIIENEISKDDIKSRTDFRNDVVFTIDGKNTKDMDDAVSIEKLDNGNYLLKVHIADVSHYVKSGMSLFDEALKRNVSVYLANTVIPMLPHKLSNGICSLNPNEDRLTKSIIMEIDENGECVDYNICNGVIRSKMKMAYEDINDILINENIHDDYKPFMKDLYLMYELSLILEKNRNKKGNIEFSSNEIEIINDKDGNPIKFQKHDNKVAEKIIEYFMIIANETVANYFSWLDLPFIYRIHNTPNKIKLDETIKLINKLGYKLVRIQNAYGQKAIQKILNDYKGTMEYDIISNLLLKNMAKAKYSIKNEGHFGLSSDYYCHFTSPIRRFPDLMIHTLLSNILDNKFDYKNIKKVNDELFKISEYSSEKERQEDDAEREYLKYEMAKYMKDKINDEFEGVLVDVDKKDAYIKLNNGIIGKLSNCSDYKIDLENKQLIKNKDKIKLGYRLLIKVTDINLENRNIYFDVVKVLEIKSKKLSKRKI